MRTYLYTYSVGTPPRDGSGMKKTCRIYWLDRGEARFLVERTDSFVDEFQLVLDAMEELTLYPAKAGTAHAKARLPRRAFAKNPNTSGRMFSHASRLREAGIANFQRID